MSLFPEMLRVQGHYISYQIKTHAPAIYPVHRPHKPMISTVLCEMSQTISLSMSNNDASRFHNSQVPIIMTTPLIII
jgi:hypothetical protein